MRAASIPSILGGLAVATAGHLAPGQVDRHLYTLSGDNPDSAFGGSVASVGDVDGDGVPDIAVGAPEDTTHGNRAGICRVFSGKDGRVIWTLITNIPGHVVLDGHRFGCAVAAAGDVDGDYASDLIVGAWGFSTTMASRIGCAQVVSGKTGRVLHTFLGRASEDYFGSSVAGGKDVDGDKVPDLAVGATETRQASTPGNGYVRVYSGKDGRLIRHLTGSFTTVGSAFGQSVALADVDGNGIAEVVVGSPYDRKPTTPAGSVYAFVALTGTQIWAFSRPTTSDQLGWSVAAVGDLDRDSAEDIVAGGPNASLAGGVALAISTKSQAVIHTWLGTANDGLGTSVAGAGDVDRDGVNDVIVGSQPTSKPGFADVYSGKSGLGLLRIDGVFLSDEYEIARLVGGAGDVNGDGYADLLVGAPGSGPSQARTGRAHVYSGRVLSMTAMGHEASLSLLGTVLLRLGAGSVHGGKPYLLLGSLSGTTPSIQLGNVTLPLNPIQDTYFMLTLSYPNTLMLSNSLGTLDANGRAIARFRAMPELPRSLAGRTVHHAFVAFGTQPFDFASNAVGIRLTQ